MNKPSTFKRILVSTMLVGSILLIGTQAFAYIGGTYDGYPTATVKLDGNTLSFDVPAIIENSRTFVPLRGIFEALNAKVFWNEYTRTVTAIRGTTTIKLTIDEKTAYVDDRQVTLDVPPTILNGRTLVPLRFISESLGAQVTWDGSTDTVGIASPSIPQGSDSLIVKGSSTNVDGIIVKYGTHTYGAENQEQYDAIMAAVNDTINTYYNSFPFGGIFSEQYQEYLDGKRPNWRVLGIDASWDEKGIRVADGSIGDLVKAGVSKYDIIKAWKGTQLIGYLVPRGINATQGDNGNAYNSIVTRNNTNADNRRVVQAVFDALGFNTMIVGDFNADGEGIMDAIVQINGNWYLEEGFISFDLQANVQGGEQVVVDSTY